MFLHQLKTLLREHTGRSFRLLLPDGSPVPVSFHVTEVGRVDKTFIDCGGTLRETSTCQLQVRVGEDFNHRIEAGKAAAILDKAAAYLPDETIPVEIEYEDQVISQYTIEDHEVRSAPVVLKLGHKHTDCLAKDSCVVPAARKADGSTAAAACCGGAAAQCC